MNQKPAPTFVSKTGFSDIESSIIFKKNIESFRFYCPYLYERYKNYRPTNIRFGFDEHDMPNFISNNQYLIKDHEAIEQKISDFINTPQCMQFNLGTPEWKKTEFLQDFHLERIRRVFHEQPEDARLDYPEIVPTMLFLGVGLGSQISTIESHFDIRNIIVIEPDDDIFFGAMWYYDWEPLLRKMSSPGHSIKFEIGGQPQIIAENLINNIRLRGGYTCSEMFVFSHYAHDALISFYQHLTRSFHRAFYCLGFVEDELIGFSHLLLKMRQNSNYLKDAIQTCDVPVFLIGSGPSLDNDIELIKQFQHQAIVISCSSSIEICYKHGIVPSFHVEVERNKIVTDRIERFPDKDFLSQIILLGVSTLHPGTMQYFKDFRFVLKNADFGASLFQAIFPSLLTTQPCTHPTSGNGMVGMAYRLGFRNLILFGLDFGMKNERQHHSKDTLYFDENQEWTLPHVDAQVYLPGNFGGIIPSTFLLETSRYAISHFLKEHPDIMCKNTSDGALIEGAIPTRAEHLEHSVQFVSLDKPAIIAQQLEDCTLEVNYPEYCAQLETAWMKLYLIMENTIEHYLKFIEKPILNKRELMDQLDLQTRYIHGVFAHNKMLGVLLGGTFLQLQNCIAALALKIKSGPVLQETVAAMAKISRENLTDSLELYKESKHYATEDYDFDKYKRKYPAAFAEHQKLLAQTQRTFTVK